jgi:hypothetical protein
VSVLVGADSESSVDEGRQTGRDSQGTAPSKGARGVDWKYEGLFLVAVLISATLCLTLAGRRPGWPTGQLLADPTIVQMYAAHFRHGDFLPVWSSSDAFGMGSPVLLYYHRVFFTMAGVIFIVLDGALKPTLMATVAVFMVIGAYGMRKALGVVTGYRWLAAVGSIGFLFTNWGFGEWLVRGDLAEFTAFMFVPWLLFCCLTLVKDGRLSWLIVPVMVLLVESHSAIGLVSIIMLVCTGAIFVVYHGWAGVRSIAPRLTVAVAATAAILLPLLTAEARMGRFYDPITVTINESSPFSGNFSHPLSYLFDPSYHWLSGSDNSVVPVQMDLPITALLAVGLVTILWLWATRSRRRSKATMPRLERPVITLLVLGLVLYLLLQFRFTIPLYNAVSVMKVIAYPFRMMTFIVPLALVLAVAVADWYLRAYRTRWPGASALIPAGLAGAWLISMVLLSPVTAHEPAPATNAFFPYSPFLPVGMFTRPPHTSFQTSSATPLFQEYLPRVEQPNGTQLVFDTGLYGSLYSHHTEAESLSSVPCSVVQTSGTVFESLRATYTVTCQGPARVALPISYNPFTTITELVPGGAPGSVPVLHVVTDPRIVVRITSAGPHTLVVRLPTLAGILFG